MRILLRLLGSKNYDYWVYYEGVKMLEAIVYVVEQIDGDYANLRRVDEPESELKVVARALLPEGIEEGTVLKYEMFQYKIDE